MKETLRFITCGSVDDGKSTLIGRLLFDSKQIFDDQMAALEKDSVRHGTQGNEVDLALLVDGLQAEREQGITIDVAYRFFATPKRHFIVADTPGHEQYTRNMATGASTADLAVLLIDARKGVLTQTRRHSRIVQMIGVRHVVLAVNKMDAVNWDRKVFDAIVADYDKLASELSFASLQAIPMSALRGDNIMRRSDALTWYDGPTLIEHLESVEVADARSTRVFRMPVQWVNRPNPDFRGYCGRVAAGTVHVGDRVRSAPSGAEARVKSIIVGNGEQPSAKGGESITLTLDREIDTSRGNVLAAASDPVDVSDQFEARVLCLSESTLVPGRPYLLKLHAAEVSATINTVKYRLDVNTGAHTEAKALQLNDIGLITLTTQRPIPFEPYDRSKALGAFILVDRATNETVGAGMINLALHRATNLHWQALDVNKEARAAIKTQKPVCLWFTGLSGSGKSTIANLLEKNLYAAGRHTYILDGDNVRHGLNRDLGFSEADRMENIRRIAEVSKLMVDAGLMVMVAFISPYRYEREFARSLFAPGEFVEIHVDASLEECERRDPHGLYAKARRGELKEFTGVDSPYEAPKVPELRLDTEADSPEECVKKVLALL